MGSEAWELERRYSVPGALDTRGLEGAPASEDLHAWSIYRQNLNSDFTDSALGSAEKSPLPYGNFQLRDSTVQSILRHPRYGPKSPLASNSYTYLKFGLPRVLPPSVLRARDAASSGYDSSEEGRIRAAHHQQLQLQLQLQQHHHQQQQQLLNNGHQSGRNSAFASVPAMRPARSDPDFRNNGVSPQSHEFHGLPGSPSGPQVVGVARSICREAAAARARSASEANLLQHHQSSSLARSPLRSSQHQLSAAQLAHQVQSQQMANRRHSIAPIDPGIVYERRLPMSASSSNNHNHSGNGMIQLHHAQGGPAAHPHLQLRGAEARGTYAAQLGNISFEAGAGDLCAVISTSEKEGTLIVETISGRKRIARGDVLLNGRPVSEKTLRSCVAYLAADAPPLGLCSNLTTLQYLSFYKLLRGAPGVSDLEIESILQELGLDAVKECLVSSLTCSESRRLGLACRLIEGTQILTLDRPTRGLDIFDTFFLVDYLRQWALRGQRLVVLTLHPPTYEILTMLSRVTLTSEGRLMYSGPRRDMLPYFAFAEFPCPPFKNPSDYYLDLVTLDDLSSEAKLESSQRIEHLAELARARLPPLTEPGAPGPLPPFNYGANFFVQLYAIILRSLVYSQPWTLANFLKKIMIAGSLSVILGSVFWNVTSDANLQLKDRIGFHYASLGVLFWPLSLLGVVEVIKSRAGVEKDIADGLYSRFSYIIVELFSSIVIWGSIYLAYLTPAFTMTGLHISSTSSDAPLPHLPEENFDNLVQYLSIGVLYLLLQHFICILFSRICKWPFLSILFSGLTIGEMTLAAGFTLHIDNMPELYKYASPLRWVFSLLIPRLYNKDAMSKLKNCKAKQNQRLDIITQSTCEIPDGDVVLREISLDQMFDGQYRLWLLIAVGILLMAIFLAFLIIKYTRTKNSLRSVPNKP